MGRYKGYICNTRATAALLLLISCVFQDPTHIPEIAGSGVVGGAQKTQRKELGCKKWHSQSKKDLLATVAQGIEAAAADRARATSSAAVAIERHSGLRVSCILPNLHPSLMPV